jgi:diguanylate cyclase (GGDEF)-like protein/PAS domain S-box-containing protein
MTRVLKIAAEASKSRVQLWQLYLSVGTMVCALYVFVPPLKGSGPVINLLGLSGVVAVVVGIRRNRPKAQAAWWCFAVGLLLFWAGDLYTYSYPKLFGADVPFPSFGDALYLGVYPVLMTGLMLIVRRRNRTSDRPGVIDSLIMTLGLALLSWIVLIAPYVHDQTLSLLPKLVSVGYPLGDIILLAAGVRLAIDAGKRQPAFYLLIASIMTLLVTDFAYGVVTLQNAYHHQLSLDVGWIFFYLLWGAAALHPSMRGLEHAAPNHQPRLTPFRLSLLTAASLIAPGIEITKELRRGDGDLVVIIGASVVLFGLVIARMAGLVRQRERSVARERTLTAAGAMLVAASSGREIAAAALQAAESLVDRPAEARLCRLEQDAVRVFGADGDAVDGVSEWVASTQALTTVIAATGGDSTVAHLSEAVREALRLRSDHDRAILLELPVQDGTAGLLLVANNAAAANTVQDGLRTLASQVSLALESAELTQEMHRRASEARFASLVQNSSDLITVLDADANVVYQSPSIQRVLGYEPDEVLGGPFEVLLHANEKGRLLRRLTNGALVPRTQPEVIECSLRHKDGSVRHFEILHTELHENGVVQEIVLNGRDVSERKAFEEQLAHQAFHDPVTHLANRALFNERVRHAVARARREQIGLAVIFLDLDDFKTVNDSLGHAAGDRVLLEVAQRLATGIRASDTAARFGGDEFAVLLEDVEGPQRAAETAERILEALARPLSLEHKDLTVRASLGISVVEAGTPTDAEELIRNADAAMYIAKGEGKGSYRVFEPAMHERVLDRLELRADLQRALGSDQFELYYQPVVRLEDGAVSGVEALLRWHHPERGLVPPDDFIPFAEETGLIIPLGRWVLREGCRQAKLIRQQVQSDRALSMSINLSVKQLLHSDIVADVREALAESGLEPSGLTLEITESVMMTDTELAVKRLGELKELGVRLAMDDFGTGYSSLSYLSRFPLDVLKMDRSLLGAGASPVTSGLATAVLGLGETFGVEVVAEGIELPDQWTTLRDLGCEFGQGFYFARPMERQGLLDYLERRDGSGVARDGQTPAR